MTKPHLVLARMVVFVLGASPAVLAANDPVIFAFETNPWFNFLIVLVLLISLGLLGTFWGLLITVS